MGSSSMANVVPFDTFVFLVWRTAVIALGAVRQARHVTVEDSLGSPQWESSINHTPSSFVSSDSSAPLMTTPSVRDRVCAR